MQGVKTIDICTASKSKNSAGKEHSSEVQVPENLLQYTHKMLVLCSFPPLDFDLSETHVTRCDGRKQRAKCSVCRKSTLFGGNDSNDAAVHMHCVWKCESHWAFRSGWCGAGQAEWPLRPCLAPKPLWLHKLCFWPQCITAPLLLPSAICRPRICFTRWAKPSLYWS